MGIIKPSLPSLPTFPTYLTYLSSLPYLPYLPHLLTYLPYLPKLYKTPGTGHGPARAAGYSLQFETWDVTVGSGYK